MKKYVLVVVIMAMLVGLVGCSSPATAPTKVYQGFGYAASPRLGPGKDDTGVQVYSFNQVFANAIFDADGKIISIYIDEVEVATPNYDGASMPHFSGFPGQGGYNLDANHDAVIDGKSASTDDNFNAEVKSWVTKRARGDEYKLGTGTWTTQMNKYQEIFVGKTVAEIEAWVMKYTSDLNGCPLKDGSTKPEDKAKYDALSADDKAMLADVVSTATMSLRDAHGDFIPAIKAAYANRVEVDLAKK